MALPTGQYGGTYWEIFASVCPNVFEPVVAPIAFNVDREKRHATIRIPDLIESEVEPIKNPAPARNTGPASRCLMASNIRRRKWATR